ncbi:ligand-binding sensor domain-containing protein [Arenibacter certesii]|uniref:Hybrid sensor histidine kinase/response regulator n=1 Tax=Arenibacter certesii TaxID=228955 RepID=A0A918J6P6_9FLAO|nr:two-component regulator propeller domain-containing protein [Arenibacter certesii]GGW52124.1 hypothetical protein GCM10007383_39070 [Arenibacter certesii]
MSQRKIILVILFFISINGFSQEYLFNHYTTVDGLSHNEVRKIVKDTDGFLWLGTQNGLNRFDGYRFEIFKNRPNDSTSLVGNKIYSLASSKHKLWVGTTNGISILDTRTLRIISAPEITKTLSSNAVFEIYHDGEENIWIFTGDKNYKIEGKTLTIKSCLPSYKMVTMARGEDGYFWIGTDKGLLKYDANRNVIIKTYNIGRYDIFSQNQVYTNDLGEVWTTVGDVLYIYQANKDKFIPMHSSKRLNAIGEHKSETVLFGSYGNGLLKYERRSGQFTSIISNPEKLNSLSSDDIYDVFVDEWIYWSMLTPLKPNQ